MKRQQTIEELKDLLTEMIADLAKDRRQFYRPVWPEINEVDDIFDRLSAQAEELRNYAHRLELAANPGKSTSEAKAAAARANGAKGGRPKKEV